MIQIAGFGYAINSISEAVLTRSPQTRKRVRGLSRYLSQPLMPCGHSLPSRLLLSALLDQCLVGFNFVSLLFNIVSLPLITRILVG